MKKTLVAGIALLVTGSALAQGFDPQNLYGGVGVGHNDVSGADEALGYQFFGGYAFDLPRLSPGELSVELGYFASGEFERSHPVTGAEREFEADGMWANAVYAYPLDPEWRLLGRIGFDFGDDDGLMAGGGLGFRANPNLELRGELVARDNIESLQANLVQLF